MEFKDRLLQYRQSKGMSVYRLSKLSGLPESTIRSYEQGVMPTLDKADALLKALGVELTIGKENKT